MRVIQISTGCSMSSAVRRVIIEILADHGYYFNLMAEDENSRIRYKIDTDVMAEFAMPKKNGLWKEGMSNFDLIEATIDNYDNFVGKVGPGRLFPKNYEIDHFRKWIGNIEERGVIFFLSQRINPIDTALCQLRDFGVKSRRRRRGTSETDFMVWRQSEARKSHVSSYRIEKVIKQIIHVHEKNSKYKSIIDDCYSIMTLSSEDFLSFQWTQEPLDKHDAFIFLKNLMERMDLEFNPDVVLNYMSARQGTRTPPKPHSELRFEKFAAIDLKRAVAAAGLAEFWRD